MLFFSLAYNKTFGMANLDLLPAELQQKVLNNLDVNDLLAVRQLFTGTGPVEANLARRALIPDSTELSAPRMVEILQQLNDSRKRTWMPIAAAYGADSLIVSADGQLMRYNRMDAPQPIAVQHENTDVLFRNVYRSCASVSIAVSAEGHVYTWGTESETNRGILGHGDATEPERTIHVPMRVPELSSVSSIALGCDHCIAVDDVGRLFTWGSGLHGRCGHVDENQQALAHIYKPKQLFLGSHESSHKALSAAAGHNHSLVVALDGTVYAFGENTWGQLGVSVSSIHEALPKVVEFYENEPDTRIRAVAAGGSHSIALTQSGGVFCWGRNTSGQVGMATIPEIRIIFRPHRVHAFTGPVVCVAAGYANSFAVTSDRATLYTWGAVGNAYVCDFPEAVRPLNNMNVTAISVAIGYQPNDAVAIMVVDNANRVHTCTGVVQDCYYLPAWDDQNPYRLHHWQRLGDDIACKPSNNPYGDAMLA